MKNNKKHPVNWIVLGLFLIVAVASFLRLWQLGHIPVSMSDDENRLAYSAYSIWKTGKDITGRAFPLSFAIGGYSFNPVPIYLTSPFVGILGLTMFAARLPFALAGIGTVFLIYGIVCQLLKDKKIALSSAFVLAVSVWHLQLSRFAYEAGLALFFYVLAVYFFLHVKKKTYLFLALSLISFVLGFYSYSGFKLTLIPILAALIWYKRKELIRQQYIVVCAAVVFAFGMFFYLGKTQGAWQYGGNLSFIQDKAAMETAVELERRASKAPEILKKLYHNKATYSWNVFIRRYQYAFSSQYLFSDQEMSGIFSLWGRGQMYYPEAVLLLLGIFFLFTKYRKEWSLAFLFLAVAPLPSGLGPDPVNYALRASFMLPWFSLFVGAGICSIGSLFPKKSIRLLLYGFVCFAYMYALGGYLSQYYFDWVRDGAKYYAKSDQDVAYFILHQKHQKKHILVAGVQPMTFFHYAFYGKVSPESVQTRMNQEKIDSENVTFMSSCFDLDKQNPLDSIGVESTVIVSSQCIDGQKPKKLFKPSVILKSFAGENEWYVFEK